MCAWSPGVTEAISSTTLEPAGISAPFVPLTGESIVATILSPGRLVSVQTRPPDVITMPVPAPITRDGAAAGARAGSGAGVGMLGRTSCGAAAGDIRRVSRAVRVGVGAGALVGAGARAGAAELKAVSWNVG